MLLGGEISLCFALGLQSLDFGRHNGVVDYMRSVDSIDGRHPKRRKAVSIPATRCWQPCHQALSGPCSPVVYRQRKVLVEGIGVVGGAAPSVLPRDGMRLSELRALQLRAQAVRALFVLGEREADGDGRAVAAG